MNEINQADENELQKAINNITNGASAGVVGGAEAAISEELTQMSTAGEETEVSDANNLSRGDGDTATFESVAESTPEMQLDAAGTGATGDMSLASLKASALAELRPILDRVELPAEHKFKIYKEMIIVASDSATIELAYRAAKELKDDKERAEALLFIIESIDRLNIGG